MSAVAVRTLIRSMRVRLEVNCSVLIDTLNDTKREGLRRRRATMRAAGVVLTHVDVSKPKIFS